MIRSALSLIPLLILCATFKVTCAALSEKVNNGKQWMNYSQFKTLCSMLMYEMSLTVSDVLNMNDGKHWNALSSRQREVSLCMRCLWQYLSDDLSRNNAKYWNTLSSRQCEVSSRVRYLWQYLSDILNMNNGKDWNALSPRQREVSLCILSDAVTRQCEESFTKPSVWWRLPAYLPIWFTW